MENKQYSLGLLKKNQLINNNNNVFEYVLVTKESSIKVVYNHTDNYKVEKKTRKNKKNP